MRVRVLGSAAGGGVPQWNCACENCSLARRGELAVRTQDSLLVEGEPRHLLVNASPDILRQIQATPALWPREKRGTPIGAIVLTNGDLDHVLGLFSLRESQPLTVYATERVWRGLIDRNALAQTLARFDDQLSFRRLAIGEVTNVPEVGATITAFAAPGKPPVHLPAEAHPEDNVGLRIARDGKIVTVATAVKDARAVRESLGGSDVLFLDGTFFSSDELVAQKLGVARAEDMAHHPLGGDRGSLTALADLRAGRKILTHVNNSNPILREGSGERAWAASLGWEVAFDGMEIDA
ncbi:MAG TPA: MBL fold metallo-hydrolase [Polyangiaceae bacterium]|jgi:pyrroloquinoline quinone biosynthesis protein B